MQPADILSQPIQLGPLTAANRIVMPPLVIWKAGESGAVTDEHVAHYARSTGAGVMIVEATAVAPEGRLAATQLGIWSDEQVDGLRRLASTIRGAGALAGIQIHHAGGTADRTKTYGLDPCVPSLLDDSPEGAVELSDAAVRAAIDSFAQATSRALTAGFDIVELHGAHRYLISQFLSPESNLRTDAWGGSPTKRRAFMVAVIRAARERITLAGRTGSAALTIRLGVAASPPRRLSLDDGLAAALAAVEAGVDFLDISNGGGLDADLEAEIRARASEPAGDERASSLTPTLLLAALTKARVSVPVIGVNGVKTPQAAAEVLTGDVADLVAVGRGILADPAWAPKALGASGAEIELCQECRPRCFWFIEPPNCPARKRLARRGEQPEVV